MGSEKRAVVSGDGQNHITGLSDDPDCPFTDPSTFVAYAYDAVSGDLKTVRDRAGGVTTFTYETADGVSTHRLTGVTDARGVRVVTAGYDAETHLLASLSDAAGHASTVTTSPLGDGRTSQSTKDAVGSRTELIYNDHGDVVREILHLRDASGATTGYRVRVHDSLYGRNNAAAWQQAQQFGVTNLNKLFQSVDYLPFTVRGTDAAGLRYTKAPDTVARRADYQFITGGELSPETDPGLFQATSVSTLGADGLMRTTTYLKYRDPGRPEIVRDAHGRLTWLKLRHEGQLTHTVNALGEGTETAYDTQGRVVATYRATGTGGTETTLPTVTRGRQLSATTYYTAADAEADKSVGKVKTTTDAAGQTKAV